MRLAGGLHGLVVEGRSANLAAVYPPHHASASDDRLWTAVATAFLEHSDFLLARLDGPPQTNEPQRSNALCPGFLTVAALTGLPLITSELGASAELNQVWDKFAYRFGAGRWGDPDAAVQLAPDWTGEPPPLPPVTVRERSGCDRAPPVLTSEEGRLRLISYVWADQTDRMDRLAAAFATARDAGVRIVSADAVEWLEERLARSRAGAAHVVCHSIIWSYLSPDAQTRARALIETAGATATPEAPLAWLRKEADGQTPGAAITLTLWPDGATRLLGRCDFHGRWVNWIGWT